MIPKDIIFELINLCSLRMQTLLMRDVQVDERFARLIIVRNLRNLSIGVPQCHLYSRHDSVSPPSKRQYTSFFASS